MNETENISEETTVDKKEKKFSIVDTLQFLFLLAVIALIIFIRQMPLFTVDGNSMNNTYTNGDLLVGDQESRDCRGRHPDHIQRCSQGTHR